jgi:hypothetical protein
MACRSEKRGQIKAFTLDIPPGNGFPVPPVSHSKNKGIHVALKKLEQTIKKGYTAFVAVMFQEDRWKNKISKFK